MPNLPKVTNDRRVPRVSFVDLLLLVIVLLAVYLMQNAYAQGVSSDPPAATPSATSLEPLPELPATLSGNPAQSESILASKPSKNSRGNQLIREATEQLARHRSIEADVRQRVELFGHTLLASGGYHQLTNQGSLLHRTDLKIQLEDRAATFQQIADGRFLWKYQDSPDVKELGKFRQHLSRVDLRVVSMAVPAGANSPAMRSSFQPGFDHGGLPRLLKQIATNFDFGPPLPRTLHEHAVWTLVGNWNPKALKTIFESSNAEEEKFDYDKAIDRLPSYMPHTITVALGQSDLFPHYIEYRRRTADSNKKNEIVVTRKSKPILTIELFEVQIGIPINPDKFERLAGNLRVEDTTDAYLTENGLTRVSQ